jgi:nucleoside-diphosphate-sugar epimerase
MNDRSGDPIAEFRKINVDATVNLAKQAASVGVKRFIYLSSIKVNGEFTAIGHPFIADQMPMPTDPYGVSKYEAECLISKENKFQLVKPAHISRFQMLEKCGIFCVCKYQVSRWL